MLTSLHIENFRGFRDLKIDSLKRVNLITGQNNTGKTGVLEALALLLADDPPRNLGSLPKLFRSTVGSWAENYWKWMTYNKNSANNVKIKASFQNQYDFEVILRTQQKSPVDFNPSLFFKCGDLGGFECYCGGNRVGQDVLEGMPSANHKAVVFSTRPSDPAQDAMDYGRVILKRRKKRVEDMLRQVEPRLATIEALQVGQLGHQDPNAAPSIYVELAGLNEMIPVTQMGEGFNRLLNIYSELVMADAKVLLIDEVENGLHHSVLADIWKGLFLAAKEFDVQIFATTHSWECIQAADDAARGQKNYDLALIRLDRVNEVVKATVMDRDVLETAREHQWEMR